MKKRALALILAAACTFAMVSGCATPSGTLGGNEDPAPANSASAGGETSGGEMQPRVLTLASQSVDSTAYARCSALASVMNNYLPDGWSVEVSPVSTGRRRRHPAGGERPDRYGRGHQHLQQAAGGRRV